MKLALAVIQMGITLFTFAKLFKEYKCLSNNKGGIFNSYAHENQHMSIVLIGLVIEILQFITIVVFFFRNGYTDREVAWLFILKTLINLFFLYVVLHFQQEREGKTTKFTFKDLFRI